MLYILFCQSVPHTRPFDMKIIYVKILILIIEKKKLNPRDYFS